LYQTYKNQVEFYLVYIREAHPDSVLLTELDDGSKVLKKIVQTEKVEDRKEAAHLCTQTLNLTMPTLIDSDDNRANKAYAGWPDRLYVVGSDGKIAYQGGPGPGGFRPQELEAWLKKNIVTK
jgi:hypothetical protein